MPNEAPITVSQLNRRAKTLLEQGIARLWVEGEISNLSRPASGHIYFSLKDENAQVSAAWFRQRQRAPAIGFKNGDKVLAYGRVSIYEARGNYQLIVEQMEPAGEGVLKQRFDALKKKLLAEGLFDEDRKQALPPLPSRIGVITSPSGAAIRDIVSVLGRRFPAVPVVIYPAAVQGEAAPGELIAALDTAIRRDECDVLIIGRGGGSLEDLWAFNDEALARAIADCPIPIVSAVGHEVDFTISDCTKPARLAAPYQLARRAYRPHWRTQGPGPRTRARLAGQTPVCSQPEGDTAAPARRPAREQVTACSDNANPVARTAEQHAGAQQRTDAAIAGAGRAAFCRTIGHFATTAGQQRARCAALLGRALNSVSPLATLERGYAIVLDESGKALTDASEAKSGDDIRARLSKGELVAKVTKVVKK
jgi:exodeoxyribonuclease VII large subunit